MANAHGIEVSHRKVEMVLPERQTIYSDVDVEGIYLIATNRGLFLIRDHTLYLLLRGNFYGIARHGHFLYVYESVGKVGRILKLDSGRNLEIDAKAEIAFADLPGWIHQIDMIDDSLFMTDTPNNRIIEWSFQKESWFEYYPLGKLSEQEASPNYGHMNSIYKHKGSTYIVCHNQTAKTGRPSEIIKVDDQFQVMDRIVTDSSCAHNLIVHQGIRYHCDSMNQSLKADGKVAFTAQHFTRGLSISDYQIVMGGSVFLKREERQNGNGHLYVLNSDYTTRTSFLIPGMVQEVRRLDQKDYSFSIIEN
ncbi:hypothetical protein [Cohnella sp. WQ 127256]|uniref:hypothetical protein n=1 Tax=Cohnella sp. WQ 127256 TaxID=2938790 RepID=UPI002118698B|nr:hypothetical protein [Cohnella sp. WQ 127256]